MSTISVKLSPTSPTPITSVLDTGASGNWIIGQDVDTNLLTEINIYDQQSDQVFTSSIEGIVPVKDNRYVVVFDRENVTVRQQPYNEKGFNFPGHGVKISD